MLLWERLLLLFMASAIFLFGFLMVMAGIRTIRDKKTLEIRRVYRILSRHTWQTVSIQGKAAIYNGVGDILSGILLILFSLLLFWLGL